MTGLEPPNTKQGTHTLDMLLGTPLPVHVAVDLTIRIAKLVAEAHHHGIVYGYVCPGNICLNGSKPAAILHQDEVQADESQALSYLSPEQIRGEPAGPASDIYALGCILYEMLTGRPPFSVDDNPEAPLTERPPLLCLCNPAVPAHLEQIVLRALVKQPDRRFRSVDEMVQALQKPSGRMQAKLAYIRAKL